MNPNLLRNCDGDRNCAKKILRRGKCFRVSVCFVSEKLDMNLVTLMIAWHLDECTMI